MGYYLKIRKDFFNNEAIQIIGKLTEGRTSIYIYIRLLVYSVDDNGIISYQADKEKLFIKQLAKEFSVTPTEFKNAINILSKYELVERFYDHTYSEAYLRMPYVAENRGIETNLFRRKEK